MTQTLFLVRHARTSWNEGGRYLSSSDVDLNERGLTEAEDLAAWAALAGIDAIVSSPAVRAMRTAEVLARQVGLPVRTDSRLRELNFGSAEGFTLAELAAADPTMVERFLADPATHHFPGGEAPLDAASRMQACVTDVLAAGAARALVVTHNSVLRLLLCQVLGIALSSYRRCLPEAEHCALTELTLEKGVYGLRRFNSTVVDSAARP